MLSVALFAIVGAAQAKKAITASPNVVHSHFLKLNSATSSWDHAEVASADDVVPAGWIIANLYNADMKCSEDATTRYALGTNVCMTGFVNGTAVGSMYYEYLKTDTTTVQYNLHTFDSNTCAGKDTTELQAAPASCMPAETQGVEYTYTEDKEPWSAWDAGLMFKYYDTQKECSAQQNLISYYWSGLNNCISNDDGSSSSFTSCGNDVFSLTQYPTADCSGAESVTNSAPMDNCVTNENDDDAMQTNNYRSMFCN